MNFLYSLFIHIYVFLIRFSSIWNRKAKAWIEGRKNLFSELESRIGANDRVIWFHCASAGEFEQGKPLMEECRNQFPEHKIVVSFFSPSGYMVAKNYSCADVITYLPSDTRSNANRFIRILHPELVLFIKYEFWYNHLSAAAFRHIPVLLVSSIFRKNQVFFKWYGKFYRQILFLFRHIFVQDNESLELLKENNISHCSFGGDTRFDRVKKIAANAVEIECINEFTAGKNVIVAGSTWPDDEKLFAGIQDIENVKLIIAPHEINASHMEEIKKYFPGSVKYSELQQLKSSDAKVLIIDNFGLLSRLYRYATICYIGGGFTKSGIHNTLEAAVYGKPVIFGPNFQKFREAKDLIACGAAYSVTTTVNLKTTILQLLRNNSVASAASKKYVEENTGATERIFQFIHEKRLLTR